MKPREVVRRAIELERPPRAPIMHAVLPAALIKYGSELVSILRRYPSDFGPTDFRIPKPEELHPSYRKGIHRDEWGIVWRSSMDGIQGQVLDPPLKEWSKLEEYQFPPLPTEKEIEKLRNRVRNLKDRGYFVILGFNPGNYFERLQWLRGFSNLMRDLILKPRELYELADRLLEYCLESISRVLQAKPDAVSFADDWGTQHRLMIKPELWREFFKPRYKEMFELVRDSGAYVYFHSDGYIMDIIPDLIDVGVDILNPQFSCHDLEKLADAVKGKICVSSDIDRQRILPRGTPKDVKDYVRKVIMLFGYGNEGGIICRGEINADVPLANVEAMYEAFVKYGRYRW